MPDAAIADLEVAPTIRQHHINEAIAYRNLDRRTDLEKVKRVET